MKKGAKKEHWINTRCGSFRVIMWWDKNDSAYLVQVSSLPKVMTFGVTLEDAKRMARDAIELYCDCMTDKGKIIVDDTGRAVGKLPKTRVLVPAR